MIQDAQEALRGLARFTPLNPAKNLGKTVYIKAENLQLTGSFKLRGAYNKIRSLSPEERERGVIACSAGNHALHVRRRRDLKQPGPKQQKQPGYQ